MELGTKSNDLLLRLLDAASLRGRVLAGNIANQNTPGYVRQVVRFEELVRESLERSGHADRVVPSIEEDLVTPVRPDGNNVNIELETNALRENRLLYETYATLLQGRFNILRDSIQSGS